MRCAAAGPEHPMRRTLRGVGLPLRNNAHAGHAAHWLQTAKPTALLLPAGHRGGGFAHFKLSSATAVPPPCHGLRPLSCPPLCLQAGGGHHLRPAVRGGGSRRRRLFGLSFRGRRRRLGQPGLWQRSGRSGRSGSTAGGRPPGRTGAAGLPAAGCGGGRGGRRGWLARRRARLAVHAHSRGAPAQELCAGCVVPTSCRSRPPACYVRQHAAPCSALHALAIS